MHMNRLLCESLEWDAWINYPLVSLHIRHPPPLKFSTRARYKSGSCQPLGTYAGPVIIR